MKKKKDVRYYGIELPIRMQGKKRVKLVFQCLLFPGRRVPVEVGLIKTKRARGRLHPKSPVSIERRARKRERKENSR